MGRSWEYMSLVGVDMPPFVSVVVPAYNIRHYLEFCLYSFYHQTYPPDRFEVIVSDDASTDNTEEFCQSLTPPFRFTYVRNTQNRGRSAARNSGASRAIGDIIIFCDGDTIQPPEFIAAHVEVQENRNNAVVVALPFFSGTCYTYYFADFSLKQKRNFFELNIAHKRWYRQQEFAQVLDPQRFLHDFNCIFSVVSHENTGDELLRLLCGDRAFNDTATPWVGCFGRNMSLPKHLFDQHGGFNEQFTVFGFEDYELGYRLHQAGAEFYCCKDVRNYHQSHPTKGHQRKVESRHSEAVFYTEFDPAEKYLLIKTMRDSQMLWMLRTERVGRVYKTLKETGDFPASLQAWSVLSQFAINTYYQINQNNRHTADALPMNMLSLREELVVLEREHLIFAKPLIRLLQTMLPQEVRWKAVYSSAQIKQMAAATTGSKENEAGPSRTEESRQPEWLVFIQQITFPFSRKSNVTGLRCTVEKRQLFDELFYPVIHHALTIVEAMAPNYPLWDEQNKAQWVNQLLGCLRTLAYPVLMQELRYWRYKHRTVPSFFKPHGDLEDGLAGGYYSFVEDCLLGRFQGIFYEFPLLACLISLTCSDWIKTAKEKLEHCSNEQCALKLEAVELVKLLPSSALEPRYMRGIDKLQGLLQGRNLADFQWFQA